MKAPLINLVLFKFSYSYSVTVLLYALSLQVLFIASMPEVYQSIQKFGKGRGGGGGWLHTKAHKITKLSFAGAVRELRELKMASPSFIALHC